MGEEDDDGEGELESNADITHEAAAFLTTVSADPDAQWREILNKEGGVTKSDDLASVPSSKGVRLEDLYKLSYDSLLARANGTDLSDVEEHNLIYSPGVTADGFAAIVVQTFSAPRTANSLSLERYLLYTIKVMDPIVARPYFVVYFHDERVDFDFDWLKKIYDVWADKYDV